MNDNRYHQIIQVAKLYYQHGKNQQESAQTMNMSRPTISRLLNEAIEKGIVTFTIHDDNNTIITLQEDLKAKYHLKTVKIANVVSEDYDYLLKDLGILTADYIQQIVEPGDIIGVSWGRTIFEVSKHLTKSHLQDVSVVQLKGGVSQSAKPTYSYETIENFAQAFNTEPILLNLPVIFDSQMVKETIETDSHIESVLNLGKQASIGIFTVGTVRKNARLFQLNYLDKDKITTLQSQAVGDICSRFFDENGNIVDQELNARTIGLELSDLKAKEHAILVAGGTHKFPAIQAALNGGYCNELVTDRFTAEQLLSVD